MNRIKFLRETFNMTQQDLADKLNGAKSTIAMYENENRKPSLEVLVKLSEIFDCSIDYILGKTDIMKNNSSDILFNIPVLGKISAGQPIIADEHLEGYLPVDPNMYGMSNPDDYFFLKVSGESMNLKVQNGDYALIHKQNYAEDGDIIVALVNGDDATLKRYKKISDDMIMLEPMSTLHIEPIVVNIKESTFNIVGKAIGQFGKF